MEQPKKINRRVMMARAATGAAAFTIVPRHVLGGTNHVAPSEKIHVAYAGVGTQALRMTPDLLANPHLRITAVCDPNRDSTDYVDWSPEGLRNQIRKCLGDNSWDAGVTGIHGGREVGKRFIEAYYKKHGAAGPCAAYADFREMLANETDVDVVKVMTPDHLHASISIAAMNAGKHGLTHKPIGNRFHETRRAIETARKTGKTTHLYAWIDNRDMAKIHAWVEAGAIGTLREIHNWSHRPVWPQGSPVLPEGVAVPDGFDWDLWLGPVPHRPYSPQYTHAVFRGWHDFGSGPLGDMGHYSLWPVHTYFKLGRPTHVEARGSHTVRVIDGVSRKQKNTVSFPHASTLRFRHPARVGRASIDVFWYDGGMKPPTPPELFDSGQEFAAEGMMFVGDEGTILGSFHGREPRILDAKRAKAFPAPQVDAAPENPYGEEWVAALREGRESLGSYQNAQTVTESICLGNVALRAGGRIDWDDKKLRITNKKEANQYLTRDYRKGWEI